MTFFNKLSLSQVLLKLKKKKTDQIFCESIHACLRSFYLWKNKISIEK